MTGPRNEVLNKLEQRDDCDVTTDIIDGGVRVTIEAKTMPSILRAHISYDDEVILNSLRCRTPMHIEIVYPDNDLSPLPEHLQTDR